MSKLGHSKVRIKP